MSGILDLIDPAWLVVYARIQACILALPIFAERWFGARVKVSLALAVTPLLAPAAGRIEIPADQLGFLILVGAQIVMGLLMGLLVRIIFMAINIAATAIGQTAALSQIIGTGTEAAPHPIGNLLHLAAGAVVLALGFHLRMVDYLLHSFSLWPIGAWPGAGIVLQAGIATVTQSFVMAMILSAPFILGGLLYQSLSGVVARVMPSLPVALIGAPASVLLAMVALAILSPTILSLWADALMDYVLPDLGMAP